MHFSSFLTAACWLLLQISAMNLAAAETRPVYARPAATASSFYIDGYFDYFDGLPLQEAVDLEGWTAGLDMTLPLRPNMQLRLLLPLRTEADGILVRNGDKIEIDGWGGTFDFPTLFFEHQVVGQEAGSNRVSYFVGYGQRLGVLNTGTPDKYNHQGRSLHTGLRYDHDLASGGLLILDSEIRFYETSDDLNPGSLISDSFVLGTLTAAWLGSRMGAITPGFEVVTRITENYLAASVIPELIVHAGQSLDVKLALPIGISEDAPDWGAQLRMTLSF